MSGQRRATWAHLWSSAAAAVIWLVLALTFLDRGMESTALPDRFLAWGLAVENGVVAALFALRRPAAKTAGALPFVVALLVTAGPFLLRPAAGGLKGVGLELGALPWLLASLVSLGPAMGMAPADRGLRTGGTYRIIRHPLYAGELLYALGYVVGNASWRNALLWLGLLGGQILRIRWEERLLRACYPEEYSAYCRRVRRRLVPFLF